MTDTAIAQQAKPRTRATMADWNEFQDELEARKADIIPRLAQNVTWERFAASVISLGKQDHDLLLCDHRSLFHAIEQSASDGLLPDGKEGAILSYNEKQKDGTFKRVAKWNPMTWGLRKRARELDGILVDTEVVYEGDYFKENKGDKPSIEHEPAAGEHGDMLKAYAIFRRGEKILHREVMTKGEIESVRKQSKVPNGLLWTTFVGEAWRKTVLRRGFKSVPCGPQLEQIVRRDDALFDFDEEVSREPVARISPPPPPTPTYVAPSVQRARPPSPKRPRKKSDRPYGSSEPTDAEIDASQAKLAQVIGDELPQEGGGTFYSDENSGAHLDAFLDALNRPMTPAELEHLVFNQRPIIDQMIPPHRKVAESRLVDRRKETVALHSLIPLRDE